MNDRFIFDAIYAVAREIPRGRVMSYGQVGAECGATPRMVGWAMASALEEDVPWHRVVGADGYLRIGRRSPELRELQRRLLAGEGVPILENGCVDMASYGVTEPDDRPSKTGPDNRPVRADLRPNAPKSAGEG